MLQLLSEIFLWYFPFLYFPIFLVHRSISHCYSKSQALKKRISWAICWYSCRKQRLHITMSCIRRAKTAMAILKAIVSRVLFALHGFICIWRVTVVKGQPLYWCLTGTFPVMVIETVFTIRRKKGGEWKWWANKYYAFSPYNGSLPSLVLVQIWWRIYLNAKLITIF